MFVAEPGDVLDGKCVTAVHDGGVAEALRRDRPHLNPAGLDVERFRRDGDLAVVHEVVDGGAESVGEKHQRCAEGDTRECGVGHRDGFVGRLAEAHDVEEHVGAVVGGVVHQFLDQQRIDALKETGHRQRQNLCGPTGFDAGGVEGRLPVGAG